jgi:hypothetical protein
MTRKSGKMPSARFVGLGFLLVFAMFVSLRILKAPEEPVQMVVSPDSEYEARLLRVYYYSEPGYKIQVRSGRFWRTVFYLSEIPDSFPVDHSATLHWSSDSDGLFLNINGQLVWGDRVADQPSRLKSP